MLESNMKKMIVTDIEKCLGCKTCELACAMAHCKSVIIEDAIDEEPKPQRRVTVESVEEFAVPMQCMHCEDAPCVEICPSDALSKDKKTEQVTLEQDKCIGCKCCLVVCPFGVIVPAFDGKVVVKCDLCMARMKEGKGPACVESCPTGALRFVEAEELTKEKRVEAASKSLTESKQ